MFIVVVTLFVIVIVVIVVVTVFVIVVVVVIVVVTLFVVIVVIGHDCELLLLLCCCLFGTLFGVIDHVCYCYCHVIVIGHVIVSHSILVIPADVENPRILRPPHCQLQRLSRTPRRPLYAAGARATALNSIPPDSDTSPTTPDSPEQLRQHH